ncbi:ParB/RepB/Spo0J family partition protein [Sphingomonas sp. NPDC092331]|jgi:ParB family chromosome partitioning protein|uniref:ParB/RepB/Spo0J family partition protein n=1 Tax=unclassified Sphingomonas TaxID=196159 RepID=UPI00380973B2
MNDLPILVPAANLTKSPGNVRKASDAYADAQLEANIAAKGVRQNLIGVPVSRKKGHYRIIAGGRRLDAVHRLIEKGVFGPDYALPVLVLGDANDVVETSLAENFFHLTMNPADTCRAFQDVIKAEGKTPEEVAIRFGLTERFVRSRLSLADLADPVFDALRNGEITLGVAIAYASGSSDRERQAEVFEALKGSYYRSNADHIRRELAQGTYVGSDPKAQLVGRDAYQAAGGRFHGDLFTDAATERWIDGGILDQLAADKLAAAAEALREREGFGEVRVLSRAQVGYSDTWGMRPVTGEQPELTPEQAARIEAIEVELDAAREAYDATDDDDESEQYAQVIELLEADLDEIENRAPILTDEEKAGTLAFLVIGHDGTPRIHEQLYVLPVDDDGSSAEDDGEEGDEGDDTGEAADADRKPVVAYSQRLTHELAEMKAEMLRVHVASDPRFALDLMTFWMADKATRNYGVYDLATELRADAASSPLAGYESNTPAGEQWEKLGEALDRSWVDVGDCAERFDAFRALDDGARAAWLGWLVARTIVAVPAGSSGEALIDHLGTKLEIDVALWWRPTATNYFDRISKGAILAHLETIGGKALASRYGASKKHELASSAEKIFAGTVPIEPEIREAALAWVPDVMRFTHVADIDESQTEAEPLSDVVEAKLDEATAEAA